MSEIREIHTDKRFAIIIAIENYRKGASTISPVKYAKNDAEKFRELLVNGFGYKEDEIVILLDHEAVKAALENDVPYHIKQLSSEYQFIFYYAGHGFYQHGDNRLTCWDTHPFNLEETCVSLKDILFDPLIASECKKSLIFLDCCSANLKDGLKSRDVISDLSTVQFEDFINPKDYSAVFMSCSPSEKSYCSDILRHGIWTWHVAEALSGNAEDAIIKDIFITDASLQNYLSYAIPRFIDKQTDIRGTQHPYAKIHASNDFLIRKLPVLAASFDDSLPDFKLNYSRAVFRKIDYEHIKRADGFKKGYVLPKWKNNATIKFVQQVFQSEVVEEIQNVYERTKKILGLRKADIIYGSSLEGGSVECEFFRYHLDVDLDEDDLSQAKMTRRLQLRVPRNRIPENFDSIFDIYLDELIIPIEGNMDFADIVNKFENLVEEQGGSLKDNERRERMEYISPRGTSITIDVQEKELIITHYSPLRSLDLIDKSIDDLKMISSHQIKLLGK